VGCSEKLVGARFGKIGELGRQLFSVAGGGLSQHKAKALGREEVEEEGEAGLCSLPPLKMPRRQTLIPGDRECLPT
jgi:hypothetical protein